MSPDRISSDSEIFKHILPENEASPIRRQLLSSLKIERPTAFKVWEASVQKMRVKPDFQLDDQSFMAQIVRGDLTLGLAPFSKDLAYLRFKSEFLDPTNMNNEHQMRLIHEITHPWIGGLAVDHEYKYSSLLLKLHNMLAVGRSHHRTNGYTAQASLEMYQKSGPSVQAEEEMVEMSAMWLWDPRYLNDYLNSITNDQPGIYWSAIGVRKIAPKDAVMMFSAIDMLMEESIK